MKLLKTDLIDLMILIANFVVIFYILWFYPLQSWSLLLWLQQLIGPVAVPIIMMIIYTTMQLVLAFKESELEERFTLLKMVRDNSDQVSYLGTLATFVALYMLGSSSVEQLLQHAILSSILGMAYAYLVHTLSNSELHSLKHCLDSQIYE